MTTYVNEFRKGCHSVNAKPQVKKRPYTHARHLATRTIILVEKRKRRIRIRLREDIPHYQLFHALTDEYLIEYPRARVLILENDTKGIERCVLGLIKIYDNKIIPGRIMPNVYENDQQITISTVRHIASAGGLSAVGRFDLVLVGPTVDTGLPDFRKFSSTVNTIIAVTSDTYARSDRWDTELDCGII